MTASRDATSGDRPVFIVGEARSGTSILYRTLQKHPSFLGREIQLGETDICVHLRRTFLFREGHPPPLVRFMLDDRDAYEAFLRSIRPIRALSALLAPVNVFVKDPPMWWWRANLHHLVVRRYFEHAKVARGCRRLVEKTPTNAANLPRLAAAFPDARFLYIHRHPVDVYSSYRRRAAADPDASWAAGLTPTAFCERYETSLDHVRRWRREHRNLALVRYEAFTTDPAGTFAQICAFLDEPFEADAVEEPNPEHGRWRGDPYLWDRIAVVTKDWRDHLTAAEARSIQDRLADVMDELAYEPYPVG